MHRELAINYIGTGLTISPKCGSPERGETRHHIGCIGDIQKPAWPFIWKFTLTPHLSLGYVLCRRLIQITVISHGLIVATRDFMSVPQLGFCPTP